MRKRPVTLSPVERALIAKKWNESTWDANIHALISADVGNLVGKGGCVFFVAIALARQNCPNSPDHRIIRATMNAVYEVSETDEIDDLTLEISRRRSALIDLLCGIFTEERSDDYYRSPIQRR